MKSILKRGLMIFALIIIVLVIVVAYQLSPRGYESGGEPEAVAYNYLLAIFKEDYDRAYSYLSPNLPNYPDSVEAFVEDLKIANKLPTGPNPCPYIEDVQVEGNSAEVKILYQFYDTCIKLDYLPQNLTYNITSIYLQQVGNRWLIIDTYHFFDKSWTE